MSAPFDLDVDRAIARVEARNAEIRAVLYPTLEDARRRAALLAKEPPRSALHGVPYVLKDMWDTAGIPTTGGSARHRDRIPRESSGIHRALEAAGAVLLGKSNLSDLALSPESDNYLLGATCNPHDLSRSSGGSTGGGAAAVADGMAAFDWGSDFGGSIRTPSGFCGVAGLRLSRSVWSAHECFPTLPGDLGVLNGMGPVARTVAGCRAVLGAVPSLRTGSAPSWQARGLAIWRPDRFARGEWPSFPRDAEVAAREADLPARLAGELPTPWQVEHAFNGWVASNLDAFVESGEMSFREGLVATLSSLTVGRRTGDRRLHPYTAQILLLCAIGSWTVYRSKVGARARVERVREAARRVWDAGDLVCCPTNPFPAPRHGRVFWTPGMLAYVKLGNLVDATCIAIPFGRYPGGLPRSLQLLGPPGSEESVLAFAERIEAVSRARADADV